VPYLSQAGRRRIPPFLQPALRGRRPAPLALGRLRNSCARRGRRGREADDRWQM